MDCTTRKQNKPLFGLFSTKSVLVKGNMEHSLSRAESNSRRAHCCRSSFSHPLIPLSMASYEEESKHNPASSQPVRSEYPFNSRLLDRVTTDAARIQHLLANDIKFSTSSRLHHVCIREKTLHSSTLQGRDVDITEWQRSQLARDAHVSASLEVWFVPHPGHSSIAITKSTLISLLESASVPPMFVEALANPNGLCCAFQELDERSAFSLMVKIPLGPFVNGSFHLSHDLSTDTTTVVILFHGTLSKRLQSALEPGHGREAEPFLSLCLLMSETCHILEVERLLLDGEVQLRESSTGATLVAAGRGTKRKTPIEQYPPLFDKLHMTQQELVYLECAIRFQIKLASFLREQHRVLTELRTVWMSEEMKNSVHAKARRVEDSLGMTLSVVENMLEQVMTLSLRIRIQLGIVSSMPLLTGSTRLTVVRLGRCPTEPTQRSHSGVHSRGDEKRQHGHEDNRGIDHAVPSGHVYCCTSDESDFTIIYLQSTLWLTLPTVLLQHAIFHCRARLQRWRLRR
jgi:hypothetical protein